MRTRVLVGAMVAFAVTATNASAQTITDVVKRVGVGGSVANIVTFDDDVSNGGAAGVNAGLAPAPGFGPTLGFGGTSKISRCPACQAAGRSDVFACVH
jgi:hypothetical protein